MTNNTNFHWNFFVRINNTQHFLSGTSDHPGDAYRYLSKVLVQLGMHWEDIAFTLDGLIKK